MAAVRVGVGRWQQAKDERIVLLEIHQTDELEESPDPVFVLWSLQ